MWGKMGSKAHISTDVPWDLTDEQNMYSVPQMITDNSHAYCCWASHNLLLFRAGEPAGHLWPGLELQVNDSKVRYLTRCLYWRSDASWNMTELWDIPPSFEIVVSKIIYGVPEHTAHCVWIPKNPPYHNDQQKTAKEKLSAGKRKVTIVDFTESIFKCYSLICITFLFVWWSLKRAFQAHQLKRAGESLRKKTWNHVDDMSWKAAILPMSC